MPLKSKATGSAAPSAESSEIEQFLRLVMDPAQTFEIRALPFGTYSHQSLSDVRKAIAFIGAQGYYTGIYYTLNPVAAGLDHATRNPDVMVRRWLLVDVDPTKPTEAKDLSATELEKQAAMTLANKIVTTLAGKGWPIPIVIDSGNGCHLLYRIDMANDTLSAAVCRAALHNLASHFDNDKAKIDRQVHNAGRIAKLPGTWARKGPNTPDRPHRLCRLISGLADTPVVTVEQLRELENLGKPKTITAPPALLPTPERNGQHGGLTSRATSSTGADKVARAKAYLSKIPGAVSGHQGHTETFKAALKCVRGFDLTDDEAFEALSDWNERCQPPWTERELRHKIADVQNGLGTRGNLLIEDRQEVTKGGKKGQQVQPHEWEVTLDGQPCYVLTPGDDEEVATKRKKNAKVELYTLSELVTIEFPPVNWVVPGILSEGLNILAGKPKQGKSILALNLGITIAAGGLALKDIRTLPGDVLYLSLEDKHRRINTRAKMMMANGGLGVQANKRLQVAVTWPKQSDGGLKLVKWWAKNVERPSLVIIDVWGRFRPAHSARGNAYEEDYEAMSEIKEMIDEMGFSALILHHCRKGGKGDVEDALEEISGTMGLSGAADGIMVLKRQRNDKEAKIFITGRDVQEHELALEFCDKTLTWRSLGDAEKHINGKLQTAIVKYLQSQGDRVSFIAEIATAIEAEEASVKATLYKLRNKGIVRKQGNGWCYPADLPPEGDDDGGGIQW